MSASNLCLLSGRPLISALVRQLPGFNFKKSEFLTNLSRQLHVRLTVIGFLDQGRRRVLKSGTAIGWQGRRHERGRAREGGFPPSR